MSHCQFPQPVDLTPYQRYRLGHTYGYWPEGTLDPYGMYRSFMPYKRPFSASFFYRNPPNVLSEYSDGSYPGCPRSYYAASFPSP